MQNYIRKSALMMKLPSKMLKSSKENSWKSRQEKNLNKQIYKEIKSKVLVIKFMA